jgi:hypothetical protein
MLSFKSAECSSFRIEGDLEREHDRLVASAVELATRFWLSGALSSARTHELRQ